jgi:hypothetical protein
MKTLSKDYRFPMRKGEKGNNWCACFFLIFLLGFMTRIELEMFVAVPSEEFNTYWIPSTWFISLLKQAKRSNRIMDSQGLKIIMEVRLLTFLFVVFFLWRARLIKRRNSR